ncbi:MAG: hypothetical protein R3F38_10790 [Gammaproteobacteria bacterium]
MSDWVVVGKLMSPFGVKGWLKLYSHTQPIENIAGYDPLWCKQGGLAADQQQACSVTSEGLVAKIKVVTARSDTGLYRV